MVASHCLTFENNMSKTAVPNSRANKVKDLKYNNWTTLKLKRLEALNWKVQQKYLSPLIKTIEFDVEPIIWARRCFQLLILHLGCISLAKLKNGLYIAWDQTDSVLPKKQRIRKESNRGFFSAKETKTPKTDFFPGYDFSAKTACHMYFFWILSKRNAKATNPRHPDSD